MTALDRHGLASLEPRERQLLEAYIVHGSYKAVAWEMGLAEQTVKNMAARIHRVLDVTSITQACVLYDRATRRAA